MSDDNGSSELANLSRPVEKLVDAVSSSIGVLYEPTRILRKAKAEAEVRKLEVRTSLELQEIERQAQSRIDKLELRRQINIEEITRLAANELPKEVSDEPVYEDWMVAFFTQAQDVADEEMQSVWAKILAGEVSIPGSFSLRTLSFTKLLTKNEANLFVKLSPYMYRLNGRFCLPHTGGWGMSRFLKLSGLDEDNVLDLKRSGFLVPNIEWYVFKKNTPAMAKYFGNTMLFKNVRRRQRDIQILFLTPEAEELWPLTNAQFNAEFWQWLCDTHKHSGFSIEKVEET